MIPRALLVHSDWTHRSAAARVIFVDICKRHHHGSKRGTGNNGQIGYGCAAGAQAANVSVATAYRKLEELRGADLLRLQTKGVFKGLGGEGRVSEWQITIYPVIGRPPKPWGEGRLHIDHSLTECGAYKGLSNPAKCILIELMRRFDGGNNGHVSFGGPDGAYAGFSADITERALTNLRRAGFIVQTARAVPHLRHRRKWRLTMYPADGKPATKDFMREPKTTTPGRSDHIFTDAGNSHRNASTMRPSPSSNLSSPTPLASLPAETVAQSKALSQGGRISNSRARETFDADDARANEILLETSPEALRRTGFRASPICPPPVRSRPAERLKTADATTTSAKTSIDPPPDLFGDTLPSMPSPLEQLRSQLRGVLAQKRGTQSRLAEAIGLSRQKFANALSGRERFTPTAAAALRRWLDGEPISEEWPLLPHAVAEPDPA